MRGRKPSPTAIAKLHGNPGHRKRSAGEPQPTIPDNYRAPGHLGEDAKKEWDRVADQLQALKIITVLDVNLLAAWCSVAGDYVVAERQLRTEGLVTESRDRGLVRNPWLLVRNKAIEQMVRLGSELGLSPASRPRLNVSMAASPVLPTRPSHHPERSLEEYLASRPDPPRPH